LAPNLSPAPLLLRSCLRLNPERPLVEDAKPLEAMELRLEAKKLDPGRMEEEEG